MTESIPVLALAGRYRIERELGRGGMATVYLARDLRHDRPVALKLLRPEVSAGMDAERFWREIATAARLQHPHICSVYDSGEDEGQLWFTMPYIPGESVRERLRRERRLPVADALRITREAAEALAYGRTVHTTLARRLTAPAPGVRTHREEVPEEVERALARALSLTPGDRFASIADFATALTQPAGSARRPREPQLAWAVLATLSTLLALALATRAGAPRAPVTAAASSGPVTRLAVLPFENLGDSGDDYFADGMADEVRGKLTGLPGLEVIARGSSSQYKRSGKTPAAIAAEPGVRYLLTGTIRWEKGMKRSRVRVSPELIEASTGVTRWQQPFEAAFTDVFAVQADIAGQVASALHLALADSTRAGLKASPTRSLEAYAGYLRSRELRTGEISPEALRAAIAELRQAVTRDPEFVAAWADLSQVQVDAFRLGGLMIDDAEAARAALERARALSPGAPDVRAAHARYKLVIRGDFAGALREYREALAAMPNRSDLLSGAGTAEMELGRWREAVADLEHAARLDPRSPDAAATLGGAYLRLRRYADARREVDRARSLRPASLSLAYTRMRVAAAEGDLGGVRRVLREMETTAGPRAAVAYVALREDLIWTLEDDQLRILISLSPRDLDGGRADWGLAVAEAHRFLGDSMRSRAYADSAAVSYAEMLGRWGDRQDRGQIVVTRALALALAGRMQEARAEADLAGRLQPLGSGTQGAYVAYIRSRVDVLGGDYPRAVARLDSILTQPAHLSRGWIGIDRTLAELRGQPGFDALQAATESPGRSD